MLRSEILYGAPMYSLYSWNKQSKTTIKLLQLDNQEKFFFGYFQIHDECPNYDGKMCIKCFRSFDGQCTSYTLSTNRSRDHNPINLFCLSQSLLIQLATFYSYWPQ